MTMTHAATKDLRRFDVCNGDADGLTALLQWRLHDPAPSTLITGLKRELDLLDRVPPGADEVLVCDLPLARNREALRRLLDAGARVRYFDHHLAEHVPIHPKLEAELDADPQLCTSLLMDRWLSGRFHHWALVGAFGEALTEVANRRAAAIGLGEGERAALRRLGEAISYNGYGNDEADVFMPPAGLYRVMAGYEDPFGMIAGEASLVDELDARRQEDLRRARMFHPREVAGRVRLVSLPDEAWSRRITGCLADELGVEQPRQAHAVLRRRPEGGYLASVRAPRIHAHGAGTLCAAFGGGGRDAAGGIDRLPERDLDRFVDALAMADWIGRP